MEEQIVSISMERFVHIWSRGRDVGDGVGENGFDRDVAAAERPRREKEIITLFIIFWLEIGIQRVRE